MAKDHDFPEFPNWRAVAATTGPVVTTLLAGLSSAVFVAAFQADIRMVPVPLYPLAITCAQITAVYGALAVALYVVATTLLVHAQAGDAAALSSAELARELGQTPSPDAKERWLAMSRARVTRRIQLANVGAASGVVFMLLELGSLSYIASPWLGLLFSLPASCLAIGVFRERRAAGVLTGIASAWFSGSVAVVLFGALKG